MMGPNKLFPQCSGEPNESLWLHGRPAEEQEHGFDHALLRHLYSWSDVPRLHTHASGLRRLAH